MIVWSISSFQTKTQDVEAIAFMIQPGVIKLMVPNGTYSGSTYVWCIIPPGAPNVSLIEEPEVGYVT